MGTPLHAVTAPTHIASYTAEIQIKKLDEHERRMFDELSQDVGKAARLLLRRWFPKQSVTVTISDKYGFVNKKGDLASEMVLASCESQREAINKLLRILRGQHQTLIIEPAQAHPTYIVSDDIRPCLTFGIKLRKKQH